MTPEQFEDLYASVTNISRRLEDMDYNKKWNSDYESYDLKELATALCAAQGEFPTIYKNRKGQFGYADLDAIMQVIRPILHKHGLSITQQEYEHEQGHSVLHTKLMHSSGQWLKSKKKLVVVKSRNEHQDYGSALKYYRRYSVESLLGLSISDDVEDDDGDSAPVNNYQQPKVAPKMPVDECVSPAQVNNIVYELDGYPEIHDRILERLKIDSLPKIPAKYYQATIEQIRKIKASMASNS